jgi:hypothetical protein
MDLSPQQSAILEGLFAAGFSFVALPLYPNAICVRRANFGALVAPDGQARLKLNGEPCYLIEGNLAVALTRAGKKQYVWKKKSVEATPETEAELQSFRRDLIAALS